MPKVASACCHIFEATVLDIVGISKGRVLRCRARIISRRPKSHGSMFQITG